MANLQIIVERLSQFNNMSFTKKQWEIILNGCGCPKSCHFWAALRENNLKRLPKRTSREFILVDIDSDTLNTIWEQYCNANRNAVKKAYNKAKARKKAQERKESLNGITFYMVGGCLTTEIPQRDI